MNQPIRMTSRNASSRPLLVVSLVLALGACGGGSDDSGGSGAGGGSRTAGGPGSDVAAFVDQFTARIEESPDKAAPRGSLGLVHAANNEWRQALENLGRARELDPGDPVWQLHAAVAERELGKLEDALANLRAAVERIPDSAPLWNFLGDVALESGEVEEARGAYKKARELDPGAPEPLVGLAEIALGEGAGQTAVQYADQAIEIDFLYPAAHLILGQAYREVGRQEDAELELQLGAGGTKRLMPEEGSERFPRFAAGGQEVINESQRRITEQRWQEAIQLLGPLVAAYPFNARFRMNYGIASFNLGRRPQGLRTLQQAARLEPDYNLIPFNLAGFHLTLEQPEDAMREIGRALSIDPSFAPAHVVAGHVLIAMGELDKAEQALGEARRLEPNLSTLAELEAALAVARAK